MWFKHLPAENKTDVFQETTENSTGGTVKNATTEFVSDAMVIKGEPVYDSQIDPAFYSSSTDNYSQEIKDFLGKPTIIQSGSFASTDVHGSIYQANMPRALLLLKPMYLNKLSGYLGFRATQVFRLVVNADPMQQGRYLMYAVHFGGMSNTAAQAAADANSNTLVQRTQLPRVEIDVNCDTEATLRIPYVSSFNFFPLSVLTSGNGMGAICRLVISPYVALTSGTGSSTCGYTLWTHFEDIELIGPALPQSGRMFGSSKKRGSGKSETEKEQGARPISTTLAKISSASSLFKGVPLLSSYAQGVSWVTDLLSRATYVFGWSKPIQLMPVHRMSRALAPFMCNVDAIDQSYPLSFMSKAAVGMAKGFSGTDIDEMDFTTIARIPAFKRVDSWATSATSGTLLINMLVSPVAAIQSRTVNSLIYKDYTPAAFICQYFKYWRGSVVYTFKLVKTSFHSGRLLVAFTPVSGIDSTTGAITMDNTAYLHREIIDVRDCNEFTIVVPFVSCVPYCLTDPSQNSSNFGNIFVYVLDALVAPDTVSSTVSIITEISMGPDFEVAYPKAASLVPGYNITPQSGEMFGGANPCGILEKPIGSSSTSMDMNLNAEMCIGEKITSFRQLTKVFQPLLARLTVITPSLSGVNILPFASTAVKDQVGPLMPDHSPDLFSTLSSIFALSRGGMRIKFRIQTTANGAYTNIAYLTGASTGFVGGLILNMASATSAQTLTPYILESTQNPVLEVQIPQYHRYVSRINSQCLGMSGYEYENNNAGMAPDISLQVQHGDLTVASIKSYTIYRAMADDGNFGVFKSIPPMMNTLTYQASS